MLSCFKKQFFGVPSETNRRAASSTLPRKAARYRTACYDHRKCTVRSPNKRSLVGFTRRTVTCSTQQKLGGGAYGRAGIRAGAQRRCCRVFAHQLDDLSDAILKFTPSANSQQGLNEVLTSMLHEKQDFANHVQYNPESAHGA